MAIIYKITNKINGKVYIGQTRTSLKECAQWLIDNGYSKAATMDAARKGLSSHLNGKRATYLKMHFEFV